MGPSMNMASMMLFSVVALSVLMGSTMARLTGYQWQEFEQDIDQLNGHSIGIAAFDVDSSQVSRYSGDYEIQEEMPEEGVRGYKTLLQILRNGCGNGCETKLGDSKVGKLMQSNGLYNFQYLEFNVCFSAALID